MIRGFYLAGVGVEFFAGVFTPLCRFSGFFTPGVTGSKKRGRGFLSGLNGVKKRGRGFLSGLNGVKKRGRGFYPAGVNPDPGKTLLIIKCAFIQFQKP